MKTQSSHTQGELLEVSALEDHIILNQDEEVMAECNSNELAERIVRCVNMHDELIEFVNQILEGNTRDSKNTEWSGRRGLTNADLDRAKQLLKQAEQK